MIPHAPELDAAYGREAWAPFASATFVTPAGVTVATVPVIDGQYRSSDQQWPRVECELTLPTTILPSGTADPVSPYGGMVRLTIGARVRGVEYAFQLAELDVHEVETSRPEAQIVVKAVSHEARVNENRYTTRSSTSSGTASALITSLVRGVLGGSWPVLNLLTTDPTFPAGQFDLDGGRWETVEQIADAAGAEAFFDAVGVLVIRPVPVKAAPVLTITGGEGGTLTGYKSTKGWGSNAVGVVYDDGTSRIVGYAEDTVTSSATYAGGAYGRHVRRVDVRVQAGKLPSAADANRAAASTLRRTMAAVRSVEVRAIPAPWLEAGDSVDVALLGAVRERHLVSGVRFPLSQLDVMTLTTRDDAYTAGL